MTSIAQQARPNWKYHSEYFRDQLSSQESGLGAPNFSMRVFDVQPGGHTPHHRHAWEHEVFILDGAATVVTEDGNKPAPAGTVVFVGPDEPHQFRNETDEVMRFICLIPNPD